MSSNTLFNKTLYIPGLCLLILTVTLVIQEDSQAALRKSGKGWLGVSVREMTPSMRKDFELGNRSGLLISEVVDDSPADDARLWEDDIILEYNGQPVEFADEFSKMVRKTAPDTKVKLLIWRDGREKEVEVTLGRNRSRRQVVWSGGDNLQVFIGRPHLGVQIHDLDADLAEYFKLKENEGVLIIEVSEDGPAEYAGLKAGDVITRIDDENVGDGEYLMELLDDYEDGDVVSVEYVRKGQTQKAEIELEGSGSGNWFFDRDLHPGLRLRIPRTRRLHYRPGIEIQPRHEIRYAPKVRIEIRQNGRSI